ncbi:MAG: sulfite exporter TauE/SafE family protein [Coriobacteriales bacterium]
MELVITSIVLIVVGLGIGVLSGLLGIGGGTIIIPVLRLGYGLDAFMATATSLFAIIPISLAGAVAHIRSRTCIPKLGIILGVAGAITSSAGVYLGSISPAWLIMLVAAIIIAYSATTMLGKALRMGGKKRGTDPRTSDPRTSPQVTVGDRPPTPRRLTTRGQTLTYHALRPPRSRHATSPSASSSA